MVSDFDERTIEYINLFELDLLLQNMAKLMFWAWFLMNLIEAELKYYFKQTYQQEFN